MGYSVLSEDGEFFGQVSYFDIDLTNGILGYTIMGTQKLLKTHTSKEDALKTINDVYQFYAKYSNDMVYTFKQTQPCKISFN